MSANKKDKKASMAQDMQMRCVSLFSGAMGLDLGLERAGFNIVMAADNDPTAAKTIRANRPDLTLFTDDIRNLTSEWIASNLDLRRGELDLLAGGPPCQSFSTAGKRKGLTDQHNGPSIFQYVRLLEALQPRSFLIENVKGILSASIEWRQLPYNNNGKIIDSHHGSLLRELVKRIHELGYSIAYQELNAADFGVPQIRSRVFFMGFMDGQSPRFPHPTHCKNGDILRQPWRPIKDVLEDLQDDKSACMKFSERKLQYLRMIPPGGNWRNLPVQLQQESMGAAFYAKGGRTGYWRRLSFDEPSPTILTEPQNASTALCHPTQDRPLTVRECARIQTFPDDWQLHGRVLQQYRLIGNAVPVLLAEQIGKAVARQLKDSMVPAARVA